MQKKTAKVLLDKIDKDIQPDCIDYQGSGDAVDEARGFSKSREWQKMIDKALDSADIYEYEDFKKAKQKEIKQAMRDGNAELVQEDMNDLDGIEENGGDEFGIVEDIDADDAPALFDDIGPMTSNAFDNLEDQLRAVFKGKPAKQSEK